MRKRATKLILCEVLGLLALAPAAQATFPGENGRIAVAEYEFYGHAPDLPDITTFNPDGSDRTPLTDDDGSNRPAWSPDGRKIAFASAIRFQYCFGQPCSDIHVMNADGTGGVNLTNTDDYEWGPSWSPDGSKIAFARDEAGAGGDIYVMNADGSGVMPLTSGPERDGAPAWSPDGSKIAFQRSSATGSHVPRVHVMDADGSNQRLLIETQSMNPNWSPDGTRIAFDDGAQVWVAGADGANPLKLTTEPDPDPNVIAFAFNREPAWSPDGSTIVFEHLLGGCCYLSPPVLETVRPDGSGRSGYLVSGGEPDWQPLAPKPQRSEYKNASQYCKALREFLGDEEFRQRYGGGANVHGKCVSAGH